jgi:hypothetical protein
MVSQTIENAPTGIVLGGYGFTHTSWYTSDGAFVVSADTQAHLDEILADIESDSVPAATSLADETDALLAETVLALQDSELRLEELESLVAAMAAESQV